MSRLRLIDHPWVWRGLRWLIGAVFVYAGILKLRAPQDFADSIAGFHILPPTLIDAFALTLPPFEILTGALLLGGWRWRAGTLAALIMSSVFALALASALVRGLQVDCGCFGGSGPPSHWQTTVSLLRDLLLIGCSARLYRRGLRSTSVD